LAGFVDVFMGESYLANRSQFSQARRIVRSADFATFLRRIVFVRQTTLCCRLDFESVGLRAVRLGKPVASKTHRQNFCGSRLILPFGQWLMVALITLGREKPESVWPCAGGRAT
jgi:hypothetical protein